MIKSKFSLKRIIIIVSVSMILAIIFNLFSSDGISFIRKPLLVEQIDIISEDGSTEVLKGLKLNTVMEVFNNNSAIFIDARDQWEYSDGHISGAINIPEYNFSVDEKIIKTISRDALIVVYCDGDDCDTSKRLANELTKLGFEKCYIFLGGFYEWKEASLPVEKGDINE